MHSFWAIQTTMRIIFENATVVNPDGATEGCTVIVKGSRFDRVDGNGGLRKGPKTVVFDASNWLLCPGLINIHDHLRGTWLPRCGNGPYENVYEWLHDLHATPSVFPPARERERIPMSRLYMMGAYKNLFSGVTTVVDHYLRIDRAIIDPLPIRVITRYGREGVVRSYHDPQTHPPWGDGILREYQRSVGRQPFVIHVEEGFDEETGTELRRLKKLGVLGPNAVLIHGIGFDRKDIQIVAQAQCHMVWCPATHEFLYGRTGNVRRWLKMGINTTLGTDSSLTGALNLLEEMRTAQRVYRKTFGVSLPPNELFNMVTGNPARALMLDGRLGRIAPGYTADLLVLERCANSTPFERIVEARPEDVVLVLLAGRPRYGDRQFDSLFKAGSEPFGSSPITVGGKPKRIVGDPRRLMRKVWKDIGRRFHPAFLPFEDTP